MKVREMTVEECALQEMGLLTAVRKIMRENHVKMAVALAMYYNVVL